MNPTETFKAIIAEPSPVVRKFKLMKHFHSLLPADAKTLSANSIATIIWNQISAKKEG
jgi:hypothetical protein